MFLYRNERCKCEIIVFCFLNLKNSSALNNLYYEHVFKTADRAKETTSDNNFSLTLSHKSFIFLSLCIHSIDDRHFKMFINEQMVHLYSVPLSRQLYRYVDSLWTKKMLFTSLPLRTHNFAYFKNTLLQTAEKTLSVCFFLTLSLSLFFLLSSFHFFSCQFAKEWAKEAILMWQISIIIFFSIFNRQMIAIIHTHWVVK